MKNHLPGEGQKDLGKNIITVMRASWFIWMMMKRRMKTMWKRQLQGGGSHWREKVAWLKFKDCQQVYKVKKKVAKVVPRERKHKGIIHQRIQTGIELWYQQVRNLVFCFVTVPPVCLTQPGFIGRPPSCGQIDSLSTIYFPHHPDYRLNLRCAPSPFGSHNLANHI